MPGCWSAWQRRSRCACACVCASHRSLCHAPRPPLPRAPCHACQLLPIATHLPAHPPFSITVPQRPPDPDLLAITKCTGCQACGHEGNRINRIKRHSSRNPCACCPPDEGGYCPVVAFERCRCAFHDTETERRVERILEIVRKAPTFLQEAQVGGWGCGKWV